MTNQVFLSAPQILVEFPGVTIPKTYTSKKTTTINGVNILNLIDGESTQAVEDSISSAFDLKENSTKYSGRIYGKYNAGIYIMQNKMKYSGIHHLSPLIFQWLLWSFFTGFTTIWKTLSIGTKLQYKTSFLCKYWYNG